RESWWGSPCSSQRTTSERSTATGGRQRDPGQQGQARRRDSRAGLPMFRGIGRAGLPRALEAQASLVQQPPENPCRLFQRRLHIGTVEDGFTGFSKGRFSLETPRSGEGGPRHRVGELFQ